MDEWISFDCVEKIFALTLSLSLSFIDNDFNGES